MRPEPISALRLPSANAPVRRHAELKIASETSRTKPPAACCAESAKLVVEKIVAAYKPAARQ
jgi:hypothetical protein